MELIKKNSLIKAVDSVKKTKKQPRNNNNKKKASSHTQYASTELSSERLARSCFEKRPRSRPVKENHVFSSFHFLSTKKKKKVHFTDYSLFWRRSSQIQFPSALCSECWELLRSLCRQHHSDNSYYFSVFITKFITPSLHCFSSWAFFSLLDVIWRKVDGKKKMCLGATLWFRRKQVIW